MRRLLLPLRRGLPGKAAARLTGKITGLAADRGGRMLDAVRAVRAALPRAGLRDRVEKVAEQEVIRLAALARQRVLAGRHGSRASRESSGSFYRELGFVPPGRHRSSAQTLELLGFAPPGRGYAQTTDMELLGFARCPNPAAGSWSPADTSGRPGAAAGRGRQREMHRGEPEIGR
jgi:hypothetical protein